MCVYCHMLKKIRVGRSEMIFMSPFEKGGAYLCPHLKKEGHIVLHLSVGRSVCRYVGMTVALNLVQLITQEGFAPEALNLVGR